MVEFIRQANTVQLAQITLAHVVVALPALLLLYLAWRMTK